MWFTWAGSVKDTGLDYAHTPILSPAFRLVTARCSQLDNVVNLVYVRGDLFDESLKLRMSLKMLNFASFVIFNRLVANWQKTDALRRSHRNVSRKSLSLARNYDFNNTDGREVFNFRNYSIR